MGLCLSKCSEKLISIYKLAEDELIACEQCNIKNSSFKLKHRDREKDLNYCNTCIQDVNSKLDIDKYFK